MIHHKKDICNKCEFQGEKCISFPERNDRGVVVECWGFWLKKGCEQ